MMNSLIAFVLASTVLQLANALSPAFKAILAERPTEEKYWTEEWEAYSERLFNFMKSVSNEDTWFNGENERDDEDRPPERDVVELTEELYKDIFFNPEKPNNVTWVFAVLNPHTRENFYYSDVTMMLFRVLAELMEGKVRFAWIDRHSETYKPMQMIYGWNVYPIPFFITPDGKGGHLVEEMRMFMFELSTWYEAFYDKQDLREQMFDKSFPIPAWPNIVWYYILRVDKFFMEDYRDFWLTWWVNFFFFEFGPEKEPLEDGTIPPRDLFWDTEYCKHLKYFANVVPIAHQVRYILAGVASLLICTISCIYCCCCKKSKKPVAAEKKDEAKKND